MDGMKSGAALETSAATLIAKTRESGHIPALDGLRGLAILMVMVCHFTIIEMGDPGTKGLLIDRIYGSAGRFGWTGVDLFFVLSGFLITGILLGSKNEAHYFRNFYARRVLRIFPLYYFVIALVILVIPLTPVSPNPRFQSPGWAQSLLYWFYLSNIGNVFGKGAHNDGLGVTWSLAIEEQFYMVWPLIVFFCQPKTLKRLCIALLFVSLAFRVGGILRGEEHAFMYEFTPCRFDAIALGSLFAVLVRENGIAGVREKLMRHVPWVAGLSILIIMGCCAYHKSTSWVRFPGQVIGYPAVAMLCGCLFLTVLTSQPNQWVNWIFTRRFMIFFGKYSYALYLFHMPIHRLMRDYVYSEDQFLRFHGSKIPGEILFSLMCGVLSIIAALLSWNLLEKHFLALKRYFPTHGKSKAPVEVLPDVAPQAAV